MAFPNNVENWQYKSRFDIEQLNDETLLQVHKDLCDAIKAFNNAQIPITDEMFWQLMVVPTEVSKRNLKQQFN